MRAFDFGPFNIEDMYNDIEELKAKVNLIIGETKISEKQLEEINITKYEDIVKSNTKEEKK